MFHWVGLQHALFAYSLFARLQLGQKPLRSTAALCPCTWTMTVRLLRLSSAAIFIELCGAKEAESADIVL
jgi:hypothetical protein